MSSWSVNFIRQKLRDALRFKHEARGRSYRACFLDAQGRPTAEGERVLADLRRFCKAFDSSFVPGDPYATALNEGRREVWNRIQAHLHLTDDQINDLVEQTYPTEAAEGFSDE